MPDLWLETSETTSSNFDLLLVGVLSVMIPALQNVVKFFGESSHRAKS